MDLVFVGLPDDVIADIAHVHGVAWRDGQIAVALEAPVIYLFRAASAGPGFGQELMHLQVVAFFLFIVEHQRERRQVACGGQVHPAIARQLRQVFVVRQVGPPAHPFVVANPCRFGLRPNVQVQP